MLRFVKHNFGSFCEFLWGCFWMRLAFKSVHWVRRTALPDLGWALGHYLKTWIEKKYEEKDLPWVRPNSSCLMAFFCFLTQTEASSLPGFWAEQSLGWIYLINSPGSQAFGLRLDLNHWFLGVSSLPTHPVDCRAYLLS